MGNDDLSVADVQQAKFFHKMQSNLSAQEWSDIVNQVYPIEFDWLGLDKYKRIAFFSSIAIGYIPREVLQSYDAYIGLAILIDSLPSITQSILCTNAGGHYRCWHHYSKKGLFGFDNRDFHRTYAERLERYDLVTKPESPLLFESVPGIGIFAEIVPRFDIEFSGDVLFDELRKSKY